MKAKESTIGSWLRGLSLAACLGAIAPVATGCTNARAGVGMPTTIIYGNYTTPLTVNRPDGPPQRAGQRPPIPDRPPRESGEGPPQGRPPIPGGIKIPENLVETRIRTHRINLIPRGVSSLVGIPGIPTIDPLTFGWGDMSANAMFEAGEFDEWIYADANQLDILGVYTKVTIIGYGVVNEAEATLPQADSPRSETPW